MLQEFDRGIFESIIEKVIVGGYDEDGNKDPYKITFIYKTGFRNEVGNAKQRFDKTKSVGDKAKELCSHIADEVKDVCSYVSDNTCGDGLFAVKKREIRAEKWRIKFKVTSQNNSCKCLQLQAKMNIIKKKEAILWQIQPLFMQE